MSEYTDSKNNTYAITNSSLVSNFSANELEDVMLKITEELYEIFTH